MLINYEGDVYRCSIGDIVMKVVRVLTGAVIQLCPASAAATKA